MRIVVVHPGAMGAAVARCLVEAGHEVGWIPAGRGAATRARAEAAGLTAVDEVGSCDLVLSICPPAAAVDTARAVAGFTGVYVDANAISPETAATVRDVVAAGGARYVDGGIIGPPPTTAGSTRLYLSGDGAVEVASLLPGSRLDARVLEGRPFAASSVKMAYAAWTKIGAALLLATWGAAGALGVDADLAREWAVSQPDVEPRLRDAMASASAKGWRWQDEMRQIAMTFSSADEPAGFGLAAAELFARFDRPAGE
jgi:3-hydroxyisobutyrate dehydrogenase-like beta-hydroxyacid dehydrogenase